MENGDQIDNPVDEADKLAKMKESDVEDDDLDGDNIKAGVPPEAM